MIDEYATIKHDDSPSVRSDVSETGGDTGGNESGESVEQADSVEDTGGNTTTLSAKEAKSQQDTQTYEVTAYTSGVESTGKTPSDSAYGITASGEKVTEGVTIACPPSLAFGTRVHIESIGERVCHDRGSAITAGHIDVYMAELSKAQAFGRQSLEVEIISEGDR